MGQKSRKGRRVSKGELAVIEEGEDIVSRMNVRRSSRLEEARPLNEAMVRNARSELQARNEELQKKETEKGMLEGALMSAIHTGVEMTMEALMEAMWQQLHDTANRTRLAERFTAMHQSLLRDSAAVFIAENASIAQLRALRDSNDAEGFSRPV